MDERLLLFKILKPTKEINPEIIPPRIRIVDFEDYLQGKLHWNSVSKGPILVQKMDKCHIQNCINLIENRRRSLHKNDPYSKFWIKIFKLELQKRIP